MNDFYWKLFGVSRATPYPAQEIAQAIAVIPGFETSPHAGHADVLREQLESSTGRAAGRAHPQRDAALWEARRATIERAARAAEPTES